MPETWMLVVAANTPIYLGLGVLYFRQGRVEAQISNIMKNIETTLKFKVKKEKETNTNSA